MSRNNSDGNARIRVRARTVDMLGRQQIAGIPTAIHELFKNAHDAYADRVEVDYFREAELFILRDDGIGMTRDDFESKWLTLGTESKVDANRNLGFIPQGKERRAITGEKGIGRLAIATIGRQVLVMTRALREDGLHDLTAALIHWSLFEVPGIDLDEIIIPITTIEGGMLPDSEELAKLHKTLRQNVEDLGGKIPTEIRQNIFNDIDRFTFNLNELAQSLDGPSLLADGHGTHFYILPTDSILQNDIDNGRNDEASNLEKVLLGFSNTMYADEQPLMRTAFRDHRQDSSTLEILDSKAFFTPAEFALADQHIDGVFDEYGQFQGSVSIYHGAAKEHFVRWSGGNGKPTECGPFSIRFAYLQGNLSDSLVSVSEYADIYNKTNKIGGLYIYKNGIRILPYGRADYDFLEIENRRTKSIKDAFFSYRRVYGAVEVNHLTNPNLIEKAGREGFRENRAYRQLRDILINFFKQLALDFFAPNANDSDFVTAKSELQRQAALIKDRETQVGERKKKFSLVLDKFFIQLESGYFIDQAEDIRRQIKESIEAINCITDLDMAGQQLLALETDAKWKVQAVRKEMAVSRPRDLGFNKTVLSNWDAYQKNRERLEMELISPLEQEIDGLISILNDGHIGVNRRRRIAHQLENGKRTVQRRGNTLKREVNEQIQHFQAELQGTLQQKLGALNGAVARVLIDFEHTDATQLQEEELAVRQHQWESSIGNALEETDQYLSTLRDRLKELTDTLQHGEFLGTDTLGAVESQNEGYKEQLNTYFEFAQVGMALGIVQHEFSSTIKQIRGCIQKLKPWADGTPELNTIYGDMRHSFEHLDSYLTLFTPLNRRLYRKAKELSGYEILRYLQDVFGERLDRHSIRLDHTSAFDSFVVTAFPSTLLPVFVNLLDNAIYWINFSKSIKRYICLDAKNSGYLISNSGPGIEHKDADFIFEFGVTRKSGGRGMGLYISRESLRRDGFDLELLSAGENSHPLFRIRTAEDIPDVEEITSDGEKD